MREESQQYECIYIVHPGVEDPQVHEATHRFEKILQDNGVTITHSGTIGRQRLAYPIAGQRYGTYATLDFSLVPHQLPKINHALRLATNVLRFLIVEKSIISAEERERLLKAKERLSARTRERESGERMAPKRRPTPKPKLELKDLDKKLDEILTEQNENI